jgi:predicted nicotinamide N-methyase
MPKKVKGQKPPQSSSNELDESNSYTNRPRNHLITDATEPFSFQYYRYGTKTSITVDQSPDEATWPGGALWDLGVLLAHVLVRWTRGARIPTTSPPPPRLLATDECIHWKDMLVLDLGCGVGLTGLVAAALGAKVTLLTDLQVVVNKITRLNVEKNTVPGPNKTCGYRTMKSGGGKVVAMPLCWGNEQDEQAVQDTMERLAPVPKTKDRKKNAAQGIQEQRCVFPDLILIGDVAYQHRPGAPSHFEALLSTLLCFLGQKTLVVFGTRMRMPASSDLLNMFREYMDEIVVPPIEAHELDSAFSYEDLGRKHNMSVHVLKKKDGQSLTS